MIFIGSGTLLYEAVADSLKKGYCIERIYCPIKDSSLPKLRNINVNISEILNPNQITIYDLQNCKDGKVFSINNKYLLSDNLLKSGLDFFNIHNGIVQKYRGISEICVLASICNEEDEYGVTLHRILPLQKVDSGPVVKQLKCKLEEPDKFSDIMYKSLSLSKTIFQTSLEEIMSDKISSYTVEITGQSYKYSDVPAILRNANPKYAEKACDMGSYAPFFPKLSGLIKSHQNSKGY